MPQLTSARKKALKAFCEALDDSIQDAGISHAFKIKYANISNFNMFANEDEFIQFLTAAIAMLNKLKEYRDAQPEVVNITEISADMLEQLRQAHEQSHFSHEQYIFYILNPYNEHAFVNTTSEAQRITVKLQELCDYKKDPANQDKLSKIVAYLDETEKTVDNLQSKLHIASLIKLVSIGIMISSLAW